MSVTRLMIATAWVGLCLGLARSNVLLGAFAAVVAWFSTIRAGAILRSGAAEGSGRSLDAELAASASSAAVVALIIGTDFIAVASPFGIFAMVAWSWPVPDGWRRTGAGPWPALAFAATALACLLGGVALMHFAHRRLVAAFWPPSRDRAATARNAGLVLAAWGLVGVEFAGLWGLHVDVEGRIEVARFERTADQSRETLAGRRRCLAHVADGSGPCRQCEGWSADLARAEVARWEVGAGLDLDNARALLDQFHASPIHRWRPAWLAAIGLPPLLAVPLALRLRRGFAATALGGPDP